ncbi:MAG: cytochrome c [Nitrospira sp.]|nr:cytochrome c [Nitrospira sp.]
MTMRNVIMGVVLSLTLILVVGAHVLAVQTDTDSQGGDDVRGNVLYSQHCAGCHGLKGQGDGYMMLGPDPANLTRPSTARKSDMVLLETIHEGKPNMPSWKRLLSEEESRAVLAYVRTLAK